MPFESSGQAEFQKPGLRPNTVEGDLTISGRKLSEDQGYQSPLRLTVPSSRPQVLAYSRRHKRSGWDDVGLGRDQ